MGRKKALILGVSGQDGPYLADLLLSEGYDVFGMVRQNSQNKTGFSDFRRSGMAGDQWDNFKVVHGDITDESSIFRLIRDIAPDEIYNLAAVSHPGLSFEQPELTINTTGVAVLKILEQIKNHSPKTKFCQISSADIFAGATTSPQNELTSMAPLSPYGAAKVLAHNIVDIYRQSYGLFAINLICYGHESPRRADQFVTKKIINYFNSMDEQEPDSPLKLGNLSSLRDWGSVIDFVHGMYLATGESKTPENFIFGTGEVHSVREFCQMVVDIKGWKPLVFSGEGMNEVGKINKTTLVTSCKEFYRPLDSKVLKADYSKAYKLLGWRPCMNLSSTIEWMVQGNVYP